MHSPHAHSVVVITGSTKGIGLGLAKAFLTYGWCVVISGRNSKLLTSVLQQLQQLYPQNNILAVACDITNSDDVTQLWQKSARHFGHIDLWINNAGTCHAAQAFVNLAAIDICTTLNTNLYGSMLCAQTALKGMNQQGFGRIFNMEGWGSQGEWSEGMTAYATSKSAIRYFTKALCKETRHSAVHIGSLSPGMVATDLLISSWQQGNAKNWHKMYWLFHFVIDPPDVVCDYLVKKMILSQHSKCHFVRYTWMTPLRLILRFFNPYYWRRNPIKGTALEHIKK